VLEPVLLITCFLFFFLSIVIHEVAHGWVALRCGDPTARDLGRLSFNPLVHIDPFLTVLLPLLTYWGMGVFFGGAKPVPVNPANLRRGEWDNLKVTAAGPLSNFLLAGLFGLLMHVPAFGARDPDNAGTILLGMTVILNLLLGFFNLIPIPPLDGSHILAFFLPPAARRAYRSLGFMGMVILLVILYRVPEVWNFLLTLMQGVWRGLGLEPRLFVDVIRHFQALGDAVF